VILGHYFNHCHKFYNIFFFNLDQHNVIKMYIVNVIYIMLNLMMMVGHIYKDLKLIEPSQFAPVQ